MREVSLAFSNVGETAGKKKNNSNNFQLVHEQN